MALSDEIQQSVQRLPASFQAEVLNFVEYLLSKVEREAVRREEKAWSEWSLLSAMPGIEDEETPAYTTSDLKVVFQ